ncbi:MAG: retropepsin-like domain-containing protein [Acidobacteria bacterium]|nr:retropepsin-like domain-containing protein [Acidobacteriota bacterium]
MAIEYRAPTLVVEARVNGSEALWFAFDTGASTCLIDARAAQRLGLKPEQRPGREGPHFARARTLAVGRAIAHDLELVIRDLSGLSEQVGLELAGIIGYTWMEQFVFEINYREATLTLWPRSAELVPRADQLPLPLELRSLPGLTGATLYVPARLEGRHRCAMEIDTGTDVGILGRHLAAQLGIDVNPLGGAADERLAHRVTRLELGGRVFTGVSFLVDPRRGADANPYAQCVIGNEQLKSFALTLDIPRRRAFFRSVLP